ncbi:Jacalin-like lectin domain [Phytophthora cactorum]|nr:Jacalin-like lectin domain [Phytophthora cactorum]KAF1784851.1 Jacalin-like lectin domain [Phytophthora cactorum]KAF1789154.1 Jacalin-like lectin domain [Phytophthora cactorum]
MVAFVSINNGVARAVGAPGGRGGGSGNGRTYRRPVPVPVVCEDLTLPPGAEAALAEGEYITIMEAHTGKHKEHTRVKYIKFTTNLGNFIEGGTWMGYNITDQVGTDTAKDGYQLGGFIGRSGDELDRVCAIWTSIKPVV